MTQPIPTFDSWWELNNRSLPVHDPYELARAVAERFIGQPPQQDAGDVELLKSMRAEVVSLRAALASQQADAGRLGPTQLLATVVELLPEHTADCYSHRVHPSNARVCCTCREYTEFRDRVRRVALEAALYAPPAPASEQPSPSANAVDPGEVEPISVGGILRIMWLLGTQVGDGYKPLPHGETTVEGDERLSILTEKWEKATVGTLVGSTSHLYRRRITAQAEQGGAV